jgi:hypothetical protein
MWSKIKYIHILITVTLCLHTGFLQAQYADTVHQTDTQHEMTFCYNWDHTYLTSVSELRDSNMTNYGWTYLQFKQYDEDFNVIRETRYTDSTFWLVGSRSLAFNVDAYYLAGSKRNFVFQDTVRSHLVKYDTLGNIVWDKRYFINYEWCHLIDVVPKGNFLYVTGNRQEQENSQTPFEVFIMKLDTAGNEVWTKVYQSTFGNPLALRKTSDGGFLFSVSQNQSDPDALIYKLDINGNVQWQRLFTNTPFNSVPKQGTLLKAEETPNGEFICVGTSDHPVNGKNQPYLVKLNSNGNIIKDTIYEVTLGREVLSPNGKIIFTDDGFYVVSLLQEVLSSSLRTLVLNYYDYDLNLQWKRKHEKREAENAITFLKEDPNNEGFLIMAGCVFPDANYPTLDEWMMRVDSYGCESYFCAQSIGVNTMYQYSNEANVTIYPNPAQNEVYIEINEKEKSYQNYSYQILDVSGKLVSSGTTLANQPIKINNFPNGYYLIRVINEGNYISKPLIINR